MSIQRYRADLNREDSDYQSADLVPDADGEAVLYADHLAALEAERAKGDLIWIVRDTDGVIRSSGPTEMDALAVACKPNPFMVIGAVVAGWTCRKVRVVDEIPAPGEVGK